MEDNNLDKICWKDIEGDSIDEKEDSENSAQQTINCLKIPTKRLTLPMIKLHPEINQNLLKNLALLYCSKETEEKNKIWQRLFQYLCQFWCLISCNTWWNLFHSRYLKIFEQCHNQRHCWRTKSCRLRIS